MPARKRAFDEVDSSVVSSTPAAPPNSLLHKIRNTWEFAALMQYIFFFGEAVRIDRELDIDDLEAECLKPNSEKLTEIGLALLKNVSSHKGLTPEIFDEYTRRQYLAKAPQRNPFGEDEEPAKFADFDVFTKLKVLYQLSVWTLINPDRIRERMPEEKEADQTQWRIEPLGWDKDERSYIVLDDDRLYRKTDPPPPPEPAPKPKAKAKKGKAKGRGGRRQSKRLKVSHDDDTGLDDGTEMDAIEADGEETEVREEEEKPPVPEEDDGLGGAKWECIAITYEEYKSFLESIQKSRDPDEKVLHRRLTLEVLPIIEKRAEAQARKLAARQRELQTLEKMATAKRSSRIASRTEKQKEIEEAEEAERKRISDLAMAKREQAKQHKLEEDRESRMMTREQRLKDREIKRILHEEELSRLREGSMASEASTGRTSERHRQAEMEKREKELQKIVQEQEDDWYFDCAVCGTHGKNLDDGSHSMACEKCNVWQHSGCHGISPEQAEKDDFHFLCASCRKTGLKLKLQSSASPEDKTKHVANSNGVSAGSSLNGVNGHHPGHHSQPDQPLVQPPPPTLSGPSFGSMASGHVNGTHFAQHPQAQPNNNPPVHPTPQAHGGPAHIFAKPANSFISFPPPAPTPYVPSPSHTFSTPASGRPLPPQSPHIATPHAFALSGNSVAATPYNSFQAHGYQHTPASASRPALATASFANSPTPSLSATQGATDFHFSPAPAPSTMPRPHETPSSNHNNNPNDINNSNLSEEQPFFSPEAASFVSASAYIPTTSAPTVSALSPTKHDPIPPPRSESPMLPPIPSTEVDNNGGYDSPGLPSAGRQSGVGVGLPDIPIPDLRSSPEIEDERAEKGRSPSKIDLPLSSPMLGAQTEEGLLGGGVRDVSPIRGGGEGMLER